MTGFANQVLVHTSGNGAISEASITGNAEILGVMVTTSNAAAAIAIFHDSATNNNEIFRLTTSGTGDQEGPKSVYMGIPFKVDVGLFIEGSADHSISVFVRRGTAA